jgi:N-acetylmuramoyl-L-alanine amidase
MREALSERPSQERTRREFQQAISAYRSVYFGLPTSTRAAASAFRVAELLLEMGRQFDDKKALEAAVRQYQFLRREYPGSSLRMEALFTIGEIYKDDLGDGEQAQTAFEEFVRRYPRHRLTGEARAALAELTEQAAAVKAKDSNPSENSAVAEPEKREPGPAAKAPDEEAARSAVRLVRVTGVRHLSLPDYTRITIDLERDVPYESQRIDNPARVYFDLAGTELDSALLGKTLEVDDDFLRQIRIAQYPKKRGHRGGWHWQPHARGRARLHHSWL